MASSSAGHVLAEVDDLHTPDPEPDAEADPQPDPEPDQTSEATPVVASTGTNLSVRPSDAADVKSEPFASTDQRMYIAPLSSLGLTDRPRAVSPRTVITSTISSRDSLVQAAADAVVRHLGEGLIVGPGWELEATDVVVSSPRLLTIRMSQRVNGTRIRYGDVRVTFSSRTNGFDPEIALLEEGWLLPSDTQLKRVAGIFWADSIPSTTPSLSLAEFASLHGCVALSTEQEASQFADCSFHSARRYYDPVLETYIWHAVENDGWHLYYSDQVTPTLLEDFSPDADGFVQASIRRIEPSNSTETSVASTPTSTEWVHYRNVGSCVVEIGLEGAVYAIQQINDVDSGEQAEWGHNCPPTVTPTFTSCIGTNCLGSNYFRQQTVYYWVKAARDMSRVYAFDVVTPIDTQALNVNIDTGSAVCGGARACYTPVGHLMSLNDPDESPNDLHYLPATIAHEYGHHFGNAYDGYSGPECTLLTSHSAALREATADLVYLATIEREKGSTLRYAFGTNRTSNSSWHRNAATLLAPNINAWWCGDIYDFGDGFKQAWYEIMNDLNCSASTCSTTATGGSFNGSTSTGIGWSSSSQARADVIEAMVGALQTEGFFSHILQFSDAMVDYLGDDLGHSAAFISNVNSVLNHHGL